MMQVEVHKLGVVVFCFVHLDRNKEDVNGSGYGLSYLITVLNSMKGKYGLKIAILMALYVSLLYLIQTLSVYIKTI